MSALRRLRLSAALLATLILAACGGSTPSSPSNPPSNDTPFDSRYSLASFREAGRITAVAGNEVLHALRPGLFERDVKQIVDGVFSREGSGAPAFAHIVGAGTDALDIHYAGDSRQLGDGELLLIDIGATSNQHCSDMSRTYPASGQFTARQLELYQLVLQAQQQAASSIRVGVDTANGLTSLVRTLYRSSPLRAKDTSGVERTLDAFMVHTVSHYVGREVHGSDTGWNLSAPIQVNQVFTIEPGLYIISEGIGMRIEDTYVATSNGLECLTCAASKDPAAVQRLR